MQCRFVLPGLTRPIGAAGRHPVSGWLPHESREGQRRCAGSPAAGAAAFTRWRVANSTGSTVLRSAVLVAVLAQEAALQEPLEAAEGIRSLIRRSLYRYNVTAGDSLL